MRPRWRQTNGSGRRRRYGAFLLALVVAACGLNPTAEDHEVSTPEETFRPDPRGSARPRTPAASPDTEEEPVLEHAVIVDLAVDWRPEAELTAEEVAAQRTRIEEAEHAVLRALGDHGQRQRRLHATGQISLLVDATGLEFLRGHPDVGAIHQDRDDPPTG